MWIAAVLVNLAVSIWWFNSGFRWTATPHGFGADIELLWVNVLALAAMAVVSVWVERRRILPLTSEPRQWQGLAFHRFAAWAIVLAMLLATGAGLLSDLFDASFAVNLPLVWAAWVAAVVTAVACWWDPAVRWPVACLYCVGLVAVGMFLDGLNFQAPMFHWALATGAGRVFAGDQCAVERARSAAMGGRAVGHAGGCSS